MSYSLFLTRCGKKTSWNIGRDSELPASHHTVFVVRCVIEVIWTFGKWLTFPFLLQFFAFLSHRENAEGVSINRTGLSVPHLSLLSYSLANLAFWKMFVLQGIISGLGRELNVPGPRGIPIRNVIQTDAAINPGNSGGVLLDSKGRLIGINTAIADPSGTAVFLPADTSRAAKLGNNKHRSIEFCSVRLSRHTARSFG